MSSVPEPIRPVVYREDLRGSDLPFRPFPEWSHCLIRTARYPSAARGAVLTMTAGLHYLRGNARPYFSVTADVTVRRFGRTDNLGGGAMHREILQLWPDLAPVVALHRSDDRGTPMHAEANAWYWLAGYYGGAGEQYHGGTGNRQHWGSDGTFNGYRPSTPDECLQTFADHVRISLADARVLADAWQIAHGPAAVRPFLSVWIAQQTDRWMADAVRAIAILDGRMSLTSTCLGCGSMHPFDPTYPVACGCGYDND